MLLKTINMIYGEGNTVPVPSLDLLTFLFGESDH